MRKIGLLQDEDQAKAALPQNNEKEGSDHDKMMMTSETAYYGATNDSSTARGTTNETTASLRLNTSAAGLKTKRDEVMRIEDSDASIVSELKKADLSGLSSDMNEIDTSRNVETSVDLKVAQTSRGQIAKLSHKRDAAPVIQSTNNFTIFKLNSNAQGKTELS